MADNKTTKMSPKYDHQSVEFGQYNQWLDKGLFKPSKDPQKQSYSIVLPPPNVTGKLHLGHAWDTTLQDMIIRQKRMQGFDTLWLPGMDHAGIATQARVDAKLSEQGISRYDLGRDKFIEKVWEWKDEYANTIKKQWGKLGLSLDYTRERFTLDSGISDAVKKVFVSLYKKGLIYRGEYIINWDPQARTALSDIEVIHENIKGAFYHIKYKFADGETTIDGKDYIEIATTRPETMMGDTAIAVNPHDKRYKNVVGKEVLLPLTNRKIPIITDQYAKPEFGTGAVKITPAHDPNDFLVGNRHNLERINTMNKDATMNNKAGKYEGLDRFEARNAMVQELQKQGLMISIEPIVHSVGHSERTGVQVEARLSTQWFVKMAPLAKRTLKNQLTDNKVDFIPQRFERTFTQWMENVHDWVISRQLWWGHQIPAWYNKNSGELYVDENPPKDIENWEQDKDVLDTWFSSALWPFAAMGWPNTDDSDYIRYFPTNTLVTGYDIIFFWVSRMIFQSLKFTDFRPFDKVLLHGLIRDEKGHKMSKSLGNGIDPMDVIDKYGADALRWFLSNGSTPGQDIRFSYKKIESSWNFINKIWNASRYVIMNLGEITKPELPDKSNWDLADRWILSRLNETIAQVTDQFEKFNFGEAGRALYDFIWNDFCDWYIEMSKKVLTGYDEPAKNKTRNILAYVLDQTLRLLHPIIPFVTEKIWLTMPHVGDSLMIAEYPKINVDFDNPIAIDEMNRLIELIKTVRNIRADVNAPMSSPIDVIIKTNDGSLQAMFKTNWDYVERFVHPRKMVIGTNVTIPRLAMTGIISDAELYVPLAELIDLKVEVSRLQKEVEKLESEVIKSQKKLENKKFVTNAPAIVVDAERQKKTINKSKLQATKDRLETLKIEQE